MQGSSKKHDLSPGDSQLPSKKLRMENSDLETSGTLGTQNSKNYLSSMSPSFNDSSFERTYGSFSNTSLSKQLRRHSEKPASDRFGPYSMRPSRKHSTPMIIRAKRQIQEDADPHVTTTAQKIIETLARMSTPVANAQKVPIDSIKPLKPSFTNLRRSIDYGGPPILRSPLVPSSTKIVSSPVVSNNITPRSLPKLVDSATNTEHITPLETVTYDDSEKHTGGGKIRRNLNRIHAAPLKKPPIANNLSTRNNLNEKSDFNFGTSWSAEEVIEAMAIRKEEKEKNAAEAPGKSVESDDSGEESTDGSAAPKKVWNCPTCFVPNKEEVEACVCCDEKKPGLSKEKAKITPTITISSVQATEAPAVLSTLLSTSSKSQWNCPTCMVPNPQDAPSCVCCSEKNPNAQKIDSVPVTTQSIPAPAFKFGISTTASNSAFSSDSTPTTFTFGASPAPAVAAKKLESEPALKTGFGVASKSKQWTCPTCCVPNELTASACVCCNEKNPNSSSETISSGAATLSAAPTPQFSFGFGAPKPLPTTSTNATVTPTSTGTTIPATTASTTPAFSLAKQSQSIDSIKPVFGIKTDKLTENTDKEKTNNIFAGFQFKALSTPSPAPTIPPTSSTGISSVSSDIQEVETMWKCDICPANNKESVTHCIACDAKRPLKVNKDAPKKFSFTPFTGGRNIGGPPALNTLQQPAKTSIFGGSKPATEIAGESPKQKRKHTDDNTDTSFQYTAPEPKLKMKAPSEAVTVQPTEIKTGSFLDAIKPQQSSNLFGGSSSTLAAPSIPISAPVTTAAASPAPFVFGNTSVSSPAPPFQFGAQIPSTNSTFSFGSNATANKPLAPASVFGTPTLPVAPTTSMSQPAPTPAQPLIPSFNMTPNVNFGVPSVPGLTSTNTAAPAPLFTFNANSTPSEGNTGGGPRKIRKAMRRMK